MCGIDAYLGSREAYPILIKGLHRLEYRGYDSAGVAVINEAGDLNIYKAVGKVANFEQVRGAFESDPFVQSVLEHIQAKTELATRVLAALQ